MESLLKRLPKSIILNEIEPFTRKSISKNLGKDLQTYSTSFTLAYKTCCLNIYDSLNNDLDGAINNRYDLETLLMVSRMGWFFFEIDLFSYLCRLGKIAEIFKRGNLLIDLSEIFKYSSYFNNIESINDILEFSNFIDLNYKYVKSRLKRVWGLMSVDERFNYLFNTV